MRIGYFDPDPTKQRYVRAVGAKTWQQCYGEFFDEESFSRNVRVGKTAFWGNGWLVWAPTWMKT